MKAMIYRSRLARRASPDANESWRNPDQEVIRGGIHVSGEWRDRLAGSSICFIGDFSDFGEVSG